MDSDDTEPHRLIKIDIEWRECGKTVKRGWEMERHGRDRGRRRGE